MSGIKNLGEIKRDIKESDIMCLCETWHTNNLSLNLTNHHEIFEQVAVKTTERGRASGGLAIMLNSLIYKNNELLCVKDEYILIKTTVNQSILIIGLVYINQIKIPKIY